MLIPISASARPREKPIGFSSFFIALPNLIKKEYIERTAKFERNGHVYYAQFDRSSVNKHIYGEKRSSKNGVKALIKAGADGNGVNTQYSVSPEQQEYFKDSVVRDESGNLKVMYHGTILDRLLRVNTLILQFE